MYARNAVSPERIAIGQVVLIADGTVQSSGVSVVIRGQGGNEVAATGTIEYGIDNTIYYTPVRAETDYTSFIVIAYKVGCLSASQTVITSASNTSGKVVLSNEVHSGATIPNVTLVDTTTANSDMRGTNSANTVAPDNAAIAEILLDTNELQRNQSDWLPADISALPTKSELDARTLPSSQYSQFNYQTDEVKANIYKINGISINGNGSTSPFNV